MLDWKGCDRKRSWRFEGLSWHLPGGIEEKHENFGLWAQVLSRMKQETKPPNLDIRFVVYEVSGSYGREY
jgi:hypothetical protein